MSARLRGWLAHPLTRGLDLDDPRTTELRRTIVREKIFLRRIYEDWYRQIVAALPARPGVVLELGSGAGFLREFVPRRLVQSEIFLCPGIDVVLDGQRLPFGEASLRAIVCTDVLHHLPQIQSFLREAERTLEPGGVVAAVEPWVTRWSRFVYGRLHHEPFVPDAEAWEFPERGPLSSANGALPWIVFARDRARFSSLFPRLRVERVEPFMPFRYLVSGGVSMRALAPAWSHGAWSGVERLLSPWMQQWAMFALIVIRRE